MLVADGCAFRLKGLAAGVGRAGRAGLSGSIGASPGGRRAAAPPCGPTQVPGPPGQPVAALGGWPVPSGHARGPPAQPCTARDPGGGVIGLALGTWWTCMGPSRVGQVTGLRRAVAPCLWPAPSWGRWVIRLRSWFNRGGARRPVGRGGLGGGHSWATRAAVHGDLWDGQSLLGSAVGRSWPHHGGSLNNRRRPVQAGGGCGCAACR